MFSNIDLAEEIFDALGVAAKAHRLLPELPQKLKPLHFRVLLAYYRIRDGEGYTRISDINAQLGFLLPNTTKLINDLVVQNVVEKIASSADKRVVLVHATDLGESYIQKYVIRHDTDLKTAFAALDEKDCETMIVTIGKIYEAMQKVYRENGQPEGIQA